MRHGEQSVMAFGLHLMLMWPADSSASQLQVRQFIFHSFSNEMSYFSLIS